MNSLLANGRITLSSGYCHLVDDVANNLELLTNFDHTDKNETHRVAATRQMEQLSSSISSELFWTRFKTISFIVLGLAVIPLTDTIKADKNMTGAVAVGLMATGILYGLFKHVYRPNTTELSNQSERCAVILKKLNQQLAIEENLLRSKETSKELGQQKLAAVRKILSNIPAMKESCENVMSPLSKNNISRMNVMEEFEILERRCFRIAQLFPVEILESSEQ